MKTGDSKLLIGLLIGAALGATVVYMATTDKKDQILDELNSLAEKVKEGYRQVLSKYHESKKELKEEVEKVIEE
ncbi:MAG: YtxH domain-containing protein [Tannerellaceae bacterium]|jgi:uncharacterized membrane-anchored protein YhcB (DUF1043 family)|nr:YtxH domain-containing protein [Tannerellaceae bacterium]